MVAGMLVAGMLVAMLGGCSLMFVTAPSATVPVEKCSTTTAAPTLDGVLGLAEGATGATILFFHALHDEFGHDDNRDDQDLTEVYGGLLLAAAAVHLISMKVGTSRVRECNIARMLAMPMGFAPMRAAPPGAPPDWTPPPPPPSWTPPPGWTMPPPPTAPFSPPPPPIPLQPQH